jgi:hypothetical protein
MADTTRLGLGGPAAAYPGFAPKAESAVRRNIGGRLIEVKSYQPDLTDVQGGD